MKLSRSVLNFRVELTHVKEKIQWKKKLYLLIILVDKALEKEEKLWRNKIFWAVGKLCNSRWNSREITIFQFLEWNFCRSLFQVKNWILPLNQCQDNTKNLFLLTQMISLVEPLSWSSTLKSSVTWDAARRNPPPKT